MDENSAKKIVRFYLDVTEKSEEEINKLLIGSGKAIRYFTLKSGKVIKESWKITKLRATSRLYNNVATGKTFKENESNVECVDIVILGKNR